MPNFHPSLEMESQVHPPSSSPVRKKARRSARVARRAGPSGWKHADAGDERDLVPPSDDEEFEAWQRDKQARQIVVPAKAVRALEELCRAMTLTDLGGRVKF